MFLGKELDRQPRLESKDLFFNVSRRDIGYFTIQQYLSPEEVKMMSEIKEKAEEPLSWVHESFNFEKVKLWVVAEDLAIKDKKYSLQLGKVPYP